MSHASGNRPSSNFISLGAESRNTNANIESSSQGTKAQNPPHLAAPNNGTKNSFFTEKEKVPYDRKSNGMDADISSLAG